MDKIDVFMGLFLVAILLDLVYMHWTLTGVKKFVYRDEPTSGREDKLAGGGPVDAPYLQPTPVLEMDVKDEHRLELYYELLSLLQDYSIFLDDFVNCEDCWDNGLPKMSEDLYRRWIALGVRNGALLAKNNELSHPT